LVTKRMQKRVQSRCKNGHILVTRCNSGAVPVQFRTHDTIHVKDTRGHLGGSSRKTRHGSGAVPVQFRCTRSHEWLKSQDAVQLRCSSVTHETRHIKKIVVTIPHVLFSENASVGGPSQQTSPGREQSVTQKFECHEESFNAPNAETQCSMLNLLT
jgi:hypothetical protein